MQKLTISPLALIFCLACSASLQASIIVPRSFQEGISEEQLASFEKSTAAAQVSSSSRPMPSQPPIKRKLHTRLMAYLGVMTGSTGSMSGSSVTSISSGSYLAVAISSTDDSLQDNARVVWLDRADWLAIPMPPAGSLLRPPETSIV